MNTTISRRVVVVAACLISIGWTALALADSFKFPLTGEQCVPPVATSGTGEVELTYDPATRLVTWNCAWLSSSNRPSSGNSSPIVPGPRAHYCLILPHEKSLPTNTLRC